MSPEGAKAMAKFLNDPQANPPVKARVGSNGPHHNSVVHVTFGDSKPVEKTDKDGQLLRVVTPARPRPYTVS
jgi:hypothetical protein